ncbi:MAG: hypothetical protein ABI647_19780 [Gemmatimonadota bacterium]
MRQHDDPAEKNVASPERREALAPDCDMLDVLGVLGRFDRRVDLCQRDPHGGVAAGIEMNLHRHAVEVAGRGGPLLSLAAVHWELHHFAVGPMERLVPVQQALNPVVARWEAGQGLDRVAEGAWGDANPRTGRQAIDIDSKHLRRVVEVAGQESGLRHPGGKPDSSGIAAEM